MRLPTTVAAALALFASCAAAGAEPIVLKRGESVILTVDDGGTAIEERRAPAWPLTPYEVAWARQMTSGELDWAVGPNMAFSDPDDERFPPAGPVPPGEVAVKLVALGERHMLLVLVNGYKGGFKYRATLRRADRSTATDVCEVMAGKRGFEHWPYPFDSIEISDVKLIPWHDGRAPTCE